MRPAGFEPTCKWASFHLFSRRTAPGTAPFAQGQARLSTFRAPTAPIGPWLATRRRVREVLACLGIERLGRQVNPVRPGDRSPFGVDLHKREVRGIAQGLEDASPLASAEVDVTDCSILEGQAQPPRPDHLDSRDVHKLVHDPHVRTAARLAGAALHDELVPSSRPAHPDEAQPIPPPAQARAEGACQRDTLVPQLMR